MKTVEIIAWIVRALIITAGILAAIRLNTITSILEKKYPKLYKKLGEAGVFTWSFRRGFTALFRLEKRILLKDKSLPKEIHDLARVVRIGFIIVFAAFVIFLITAVILLLMRIG